jgi:hypothetical protein
MPGPVVACQHEANLLAKDWFAAGSGTKDVLDTPNPEDRRLPGIDDGSRISDPMHANIGQSDRAALYIHERRFAVLRALNQPLCRGGDRVERRPPDIAQQGCEQTSLGVDRKSNVYRLEFLDLSDVPHAVRMWRCKQ